MRVSILFAIVGVWAAHCAPAPEPRAEQGAAVQGQNMYRELRAKALGMRPADLGLTIPDNSTTPFGIVVDIGVGEGTATIVAFSTGDASMYTSTGGGVIGGIAHDNVRRAAIHLVDTANRHLGSFRSGGPTALPKNGRVLISVVTNKGVLTAEGDASELIAGGQTASPVFIATNDLITQLRLITPGR